MSADAAALPFGADGSNDAADVSLREKYKESQRSQADVLHLRKQLKALLKCLNGMHQNVVGLFANSVEVSERLGQLSFRADAEDTVSIFPNRGHQLRDVVIAPIEKICKDELKEDSIKERARTVNSARDDYESLLKKLKQIENDTATGKKGTWRTKGLNPVKVQQDFQESRRVFEEKNVDFQTHLRELHTVTRFDLIQRLAAFFYGTRSSFQQGFDTLDNVGEDLLDVMRDLDEAKREYLADKDREKNRISIFVNQTTSSGLQKQGYLYKHSTGKVNVKSESMRWFVLKDGTLSWYNNWKSIEPSGSVRLQISRLKPIFDKPLCFEVLQADPEVRINLRALTQKDFKEWVDAINNAIAFALTHDTTPATPTQPSSEAYHSTEDSFLTKIRAADESNLLCADCSTPKPDWASINLGSLICIECSGIHRSLGVHISKVRSLTMDQLKPEVQQFMLSMGNDQVNAIFEASLSETDVKPTPQSDRATREVWIKAKYVDKKFVAPHKSIKTLQRHFHKHILDSETPDVDFPKLIRYIAQGADVNKISEGGKSLLHLLVELDRPVVLQVLLLNGAKVDVKDEENEQTPLHYAAKLGYADCAGVLVSMPNAELDCKDKSGLTPPALAASGDSTKEGFQKCTSLFDSFIRRDSSESPASPAPASPSVLAGSQGRGRASSNAPKLKDAKGGSSGLFGFLRSKTSADAEEIPVSAPTTFAKSPMRPRGMSRSNNDRPPLPLDGTRSSSPAGTRSPRSPREVVVSSSEPSPQKSPSFRRKKAHLRDVSVSSEPSDEEKPQSDTSTAVSTATTSVETSKPSPPLPDESPPPPSPRDSSSDAPKPTESSDSNNAEVSLNTEPVSLNTEPASSPATTAVELSPATTTDSSETSSSTPDVAVDSVTAQSIDASQPEPLSPRQQSKPPPISPRKIAAQPTAIASPVKNTIARPPPPPKKSPITRSVSVKERSPPDDDGSSSGQEEKQVARVTSSKEPPVRQKSAKDLVSFFNQQIVSSQSSFSSPKAKGHERSPSNPASPSRSKVFKRPAKGGESAEEPK